jgi:hypothetical protein
MSNRTGEDDLIKLIVIVIAIVLVLSFFGIVAIPPHETIR